MMTVSAIIFDLDGVLIDSSSAHYNSWKRLAGDMNRRIAEKHFRATFGRQNRDVIPLLFGNDLSVQQIEELSERKERYYREDVRGRIHGLPGATELVRACSDRGLRLAVGSSGHPENIAMALDALGIADRIEAVVSGKDVTIGKPDPQVFLEAARRLNVAPAGIVVIEDAPAGIEAALAAGMVAVGVTTEHSREGLAGAHLIVDSLEALSPQRLVDVQIG